MGIGTANLVGNGNAPAGKYGETGRVLSGPSPLAAAQRLRWLQGTHSDNTPESRTERLRSEVSALMNRVMPEDRESFLRELGSCLAGVDVETLVGGSKEPESVPASPAIPEDPVLLAKLLCERAGLLHADAREQVMATLAEGGLRPDPVVKVVVEKVMVEPQDVTVLAKLMVREWGRRVESERETALTLLVGSQIVPPPTVVQPPPDGPVTLAIKLADQSLTMTEGTRREVVEVLKESNLTPSLPEDPRDLARVVVSRFAEAENRVREEVVDIVVSGGVVPPPPPAPRVSDATKLTLSDPDLMQLLAPHREIDRASMEKVFAMLMQFAHDIDEVSWNAWQEVAPNSPVKQKFPVKTTLAACLHDPLLLKFGKSSVNETAKLVSGQVSALIKTHMFAAQWNFAMAPGSIRDIVRQTWGGGRGSPTEKEYWKKYEELFPANRPAAEYVRKKVVEWVEKLLGAQD